MSSIRVLKINYKTNIHGFKDTYKVYTPLLTDPSQTMQSNLNRATSYLPNNTLFFIDTEELSESDFNNSTENLLNTLTSDHLFEELLKKKIKQNKKKNFGALVPRSINDADELRIIHKNIVVILNLLFGQKSIFYINNRPFTIVNYIWNPRIYNTRSNVQYNGVSFDIYEIMVTLTLDPRNPDQIPDKDYRKGDCFNRKELIKQNFNHVFGNGSYSVKTPKAVHAITQAPTMIPNPANTTQPRLPPRPIGYRPIYASQPQIAGKTRKLRGGGNSNTRKVSPM